MDLSILKDVSLLMNAVGVGNCFLLSFVYLHKNEPKLRTRGYFLSLLFFILGTIILNTIFNFTGYSKWFYGFEPLTNALTYAIAPLLFLYIRSFKGTYGKLGFLSGHLAHFYVVFMFTLCSIWAPESVLGGMGQMLMSSEAMRLLWNLHFLCYLVYIARDFREIDRNQRKFPGILVWGFGFIWFFNLLFYLHSILIRPLPILIYLNITLLFTGMTFLLFYQKFKTTNGKLRYKNTKSKSKKASVRYAGNDPMIKAIQENGYYNNPNLDIRTLADALELPYHELSTKINQRYCKNFNEFINGFRIAEVVSSLQKKEHLSFTILGLAERAGFKSPSSFYAAFKRELGTTPTRYLEQLAKTQ